MVYIRRKDIKIVGKHCLENPDSAAIILMKIKRGYNVRVKKKVPTYNFRGKLISRPSNRKSM